MSLKKYSKFLSYLLRHRPGELDLEMDRAGWVEVDELLEGLRGRDSEWSRELLERVVHDNDKQRFEFDASGERIRARQGHSVDVDLGYVAVEPPEHLYHGTHPQALDAILAEGLLPMDRHHVHLSPDVATATQVGSRRGRPIILRVEAGAMSERGHEFYRTGNEVWLVDEVPPEFLEVEEGS